MEITYSKFKSAVIEGGKRIITVLQFGAKTAKEISPFGIDGQPPPDMTALFLETSNKGEAVVVGYVNAQQLAEAGECRMYSVGTSGELMAYVWAKANGDILLNGDEFTAVRFDPLDDALKDQLQKINEELVKVQTAITSLGGAYVNTLITLDISNSESSTVKLK